LACLDDAAFREIFRGSPIKRIGRDRFVRNVMIAIGNSGEPKLGAIAEERLSDGSALVRAMAIWAASKLFGPDEFAILAEHYAPAETDADVNQEWRFYTA
jgi:epoxyqueuosine reductase